MFLLQEGLAQWYNGTKPAASAGNIGNDIASKIVKKILVVLQIASALITVVVLAFSGFNYIVAADAEMKSEIKKKMLPIVIGLILVFSATTIAKFLLGVVNIY